MQQVTHVYRQMEVIIAQFAYLRGKLLILLPNKGLHLLVHGVTAVKVVLLHKL